jgi:1-acyl-sn-glycerol-3-phosphate acyltransferase
MSYLSAVEAARITARFLFFVVFTVWTVARIAVRRLLRGPDREHAMHVRRVWARRLLEGIGVAVTRIGELPTGPCLLVSNHRSYLDPLLILRDLYAYPVAKAELAALPLIGRGAEWAGILFLRREDGGSRAALMRSVSAVLAAGFPIIIYPEGTTSGLAGTLPFKKGIFQLAARLQAPVVPVALRFAEAADFWVGTESFLSHAGRRFRRPRIRVDVVYGPMLRGDDGEELRNEAQTWIESELNPD